MGGIRGYQYLIFEWSMVAMTGILVGLRVYVQTKQSRTYRSCSTFVQAALEGLVIFSWFSFLIQAILDTLLQQNQGLGNSVGNLAPGRDFSQTHQASLKIIYIENALYFNCMYGIKCHMILFYWTFLISTTMRKTYRCLQLTVVFVAAAWLLNLLLGFFFCQPISRNWSLDPALFCGPMGNKYVYGLILGPHLVTDLMVYLLPISVLKTIRFAQTRKKVLAFISFGFGFLCVSFATAQVVTNIFPTVDIATNYMFTVMEQTWAILVVCVPAFKLFIRGWQIRRKRSLWTHIISHKASQSGGYRDATSTRSQDIPLKANMMRDSVV